MSSGFPVFLIGRSAERGKIIVEKLEPEYDVVHFCDDVSIAKEELSSIIRGEKVLPQAKLGSNIDRADEEYRLPKAVICGAGISDEDYESLKSAIELPRGMTWVREQKLSPEIMQKEDSFDTTPSGLRLPKPDLVSVNLRQTLKDAGY